MRFRRIERKINRERWEGIMKKIAKQNDNMEEHTGPLQQKFNRKGEK